MALDVRRLAQLLANCRMVPDCFHLVDAFLHLLELEYPDPWSPSDEISATQETQKLLEIADRLWSVVVADGAGGLGLRSKLNTETTSVVDKTRTSFLVLGDVEATMEVAKAISLKAILNSLLTTAFPGDGGRSIIPDTLRPRTDDASFSSTLSRLTEASGNGSVPIVLARETVQVASAMVSRTAAGSSVAPLPPVNDPQFAGQWSLVTTKAVSAWEHRITGHWATRIALVDSGIDPEQPDLASPSIERNFCEAGSGDDCDTHDTSDRTGHGTALAGIVGAKTNNRYRIAGLNWALDLLSLKFLEGGEEGGVRGSYGNVYDAVQALDYASEAGSVVAVAAWGSSSTVPELWNAILRARAADMLVVAAAGNDQLDLDGDARFYPASFRHPDYCKTGCPCLDNLLVVGATTLKDGGPVEKPASFTNRGPSVVALGAPGVGLTTTGLERDSGVVEATGTSAATAMVVGAVGLVADAIRGMTTGSDRFVVIRDRLLDGADRLSDLVPAFEQGRRLNVCRAVFPLGLTTPDPCAM